MTLIASDRGPAPALRGMLEGFDCPAILVSADYRILASNSHYRDEFGEIDVGNDHCFAVSHGFQVPCDQAGEDCPLAAARSSGHRERVLHIHRTPRGREHVDVEMLPIFDDDGALLYFVELLRTVRSAGAESTEPMMVGRSKAFTAMLSKITRVSASDAAVLLLGESGTGKELAATAIHQGSKRKEGNLVTLECAGLTESLFESELFGHVKGAFTGAHSNKRGLVSIAHGGTLFLDEIGDVPLSMQVKLLRLLETGTYREVGSAQVRSADFRLVCATNRDLPAMVKAGEFREDLFHRINVFPIRVPPLRERGEDLPLLIESLLKRISPDKPFHFTQSALSLLKTYDFPGNIRELRNILTRAVVLSNTNLIEAPVVEECLQMGTEVFSSAVKEPQEDWVDLKTAERQYLNRLMLAHNNDKAKVAEIAGISLRSLYRKLGHH